MTEVSPKQVTIDQLSQKKQARYTARSAAQDALRAARTALREANEVKQVSYAAKTAARDELSAVWESYVAIKSLNNARIEEIAAYRNETEGYIAECQEILAHARYRNDHATCQSVQEELDEYRSLLRTYTELRKQAIDEISDASALYREKREYLDKMKELMLQAEESADECARVYEVAEEHLADAESAYTNASSELDELKAQLLDASNERRRLQGQLAVRAGIPTTYRNALHVSEGVDGSTHIYYGGVDRPGGEGHGHAVFNTQGVVMYHRPPHSTHGSHNYTKRGFLPKGRR